MGSGNILVLGGNPAVDQHPIQGGVAILLLASLSSCRLGSLWLVGDFACIMKRTMSATLLNSRKIYLQHNLYAAPITVLCYFDLPA